MTTKLLSIKHRPARVDVDDPMLSLTRPAPRGGTYRYFVRGKTYKPTDVSLDLCVCVYGIIIGEVGEREGKRERKIESESYFVREGGRELKCENIEFMSYRKNF